MDVVVVGAGAVGGVIGGQLARAGHRVGLVARGTHLDALRAHGLRLETPQSQVTLPLPAASSLSSLGFQPEIVFVATKTQDVEAALDLVDPSTPIVCATNGVEAERIALRRFDRVYGCLVCMPAQHLQPGVVQVFSTPPGVLDVGCWPGGLDARAEALAEVLRGAGFRSEPRANISAWKHTKLLANLGNAMQAAAGTDSYDPAIHEAARDEALAVFAAANIAYMPPEALRERMAELQYGEIEGAPRGGGSTWQSLARGTGRAEVDFLNGEIALLGRIHGIPTPVNVRLQRIV